MLLNVFVGLTVVFTHKGAHSFPSFSLTPLKYGRNIGLAVSSSASFSLDLGAEEKVLLTVLSGYPLAMKTSSRWCNLHCLLVSSQIWWAQWRMHCITPVNILGWWWKWEGKYRSVWVGFLYTDVRGQLVPTSGDEYIWKGILPSSSVSMVNCMFGHCWFRCSWNLCNCAGPCGQMMKVSST